MAINRRDFIGAMVASAAIGKFTPSQAQTARPLSSGQGEWTHEGYIEAGGTHEPYIFIVRRGGQRLDARQLSDAAESEELIAHLHQQGIEVFHTHLYKGFGMAAEQEGMEATRKATAIAHRYGMKVDTYIQWNSMMYETFFAEEPQAVNWIQRDVAGLPILLTYGYQQSFRYSPCFSNQDYIDYLKRVVRRAVEEVKTDFIHFDNFGLNAEPDSCHCPWCVNGFRKFLRSKYSAEQRRERFGFENTDFVNPPQWNRDNPPEQMDIIYDPAFQEWIDYRCQTMADALQQVSGYIKSLNPEVAVEINPRGIDGGNRPWKSGIDHARLLKSTESFWSEELDTPAFHADGRLVSRIRSYKLARAYNNVLLVDTTDNPVAMAEALAYGQTPGFVGVSPLSQESLNYLNFYRRHQDLYRESADLTPVAVFRSYASLTYHNARAQLSAILVEQALIQSKVPFALIFDEHLHHLDRYKIVILPNTECLSDPQISLLRRYVESGGGLVVTEQSGLYDNWRRVRTVPGLAGLVDDQALGTDYQENVRAKTEAGGAPARKQVGPGRVVYVPAVRFDGVMPPPQPYFDITNIFWKRPANWNAIVDSVRWASGDRLAVGVDGPDFVTANYTMQAAQNRLLAHVVNYDAPRTPLVTNQVVRVSHPEREQVRQVTLYAPESNEAQVLAFSSTHSATKFMLPKMNTYAVVAVQW